MPFFRKNITDLESVKTEVRRIIAKQKSGTPYDISSFKCIIEEILDSMAEFNPQWNKLPVVFRIAKIVKKSTQYYKLSAGNNRSIDGEDVVTYQENIVLPDTNHDLDLVIKMLNYMREKKKLKRANMPLFIQPDELVIAYKEGKISFLGSEIQAQIVIVFQKGSIMHIGFVFARDYVIL
ncbi:MAG: hypothetical protein M3239_08235, partial [Thermoproteota archaeon]|nr:hypothetical protein [Thermoproteota archaeon]